MMRDDSFDDVGQILAGLGVHDTGAERADRIRERCIAQLAKSHRPRGRSLTANAAAWCRWAEPAAALALSAVYLLSATALAIRLWR